MKHSEKGCGTNPLSDLKELLKTSILSIATKSNYLQNENGSMFLNITLSDAPCEGPGALSA